ncbi:GatB/YqeY domain-containing protein [Marinigracilibium pacificum]|uniref:GatB/YqeY domain-containing protein n=1 Tax=Marinigracilibium pacificum TaxID=2729599 RepID=A0A848J5K3_9BACT|nr:GatB/YqeY domain-containing protein [Marinigracilibium pacificum]NMM49800.1 GatB/YqeY domain-containing protein [Marinigracilibium pacificum]
MSLKQQVDEGIKAAMKAKNQDELRTLRAIKSLILLAETEKGSSGTIGEAEEMKLLTKAAKQRKESMDLYVEQNREDLAEKERVELEIIERFLPKQLSEEEVVAELEVLIKEVGATGPQDMGKVMGAATKKLAGKADGKIIADKVKQLLNK